MYFVSSRRDQTLEISSTGGLEDVVFFILVISLVNLYNSSFLKVNIFHFSPS